jgi:large subunit ribosomal protein L10
MLKREIPSRTPRPEKVQEIDKIMGQLKSGSGALLTDYRGLSVKAISELRRALGEKGASYLVLKNTLLRRAAREAGYGDLEEWLEGPTAAVFLGEDLVGPAKTLLDFSRANAKLPAVKGGVVEGRKLTVDGIKALAELPSREILLATLVGCLQAPMGGLLSTLQAAMSQLVGTLQSLEAQKSA